MEGIGELQELSYKMGTSMEEMAGRMWDVRNAFNEFCGSVGEHLMNEEARRELGEEELKRLLHETDEFFFETTKRRGERKKAPRRLARYVWIPS